MKWTGRMVAGGTGAALFAVANGVLHHRAALQIFGETLASFVSVVLLFWMIGRAYGDGASRIPVAVPEPVASEPVEEVLPSVPDATETLLVEPAPGSVASVARLAFLQDREAWNKKPEHSFLLEIAVDVSELFCDSSGRVLPMAEWPSEAMNGDEPVTTKKHIAWAVDGNTVEEALAALRGTIGRGIAAQQLQEDNDYRYVTFCPREDRERLGPCPVCDAKAGGYCESPGGKTLFDHAHKDRLRP